MTRLRSEWVLDLTKEIEKAQEMLYRVAGLDYRALSILANNISEKRYDEALKTQKAAVVTITSGLGAIGGFSQSVAAILEVMGFQTFLTGKTDADGVLEAFDKNAAAIFMANDKHFIAVHTSSNHISDNNYATVRGYLSALAHMAGGLAGKRVLIMGYGELGRIAYEKLLREGAAPVVYDYDASVQKSLENSGVSIIKSADEIKQFPLIFDSTSTGGWLTSDMLRADAVICAPGVPLSLTDAAAKAFKNNVVHDILPIGVAAMMGELLAI